MIYSKVLNRWKKGRFSISYFRTPNYKAKSSLLNLKHPLIGCLKRTLVLICSGGRTRTYNHLVTLVLRLLKGVDYIFAMIQWILGVLVSSLYGALRVYRSSHGIAQYIWVSPLSQDVHSKVSFGSCVMPPSISR